MKFSEIPYEPIDYAKMNEELSHLIKSFNEAQTADEQWQVYERYLALDNHVDTQDTICNIRYYVDTSNEYYASEYWKEMDEKEKQYLDLTDELETNIIHSPHCDELRRRMGEPAWFCLLPSERIIDNGRLEKLKEEEKHLIDDYRQLMERHWNTQIQIPEQEKELYLQLQEQKEKHKWEIATLFNLYDIMPYYSEESFLPSILSY